MKSSNIPADSGYPEAVDVQPSGGIESLDAPQEESSLSIPHHPLGVKPLGNKYTAISDARNLIGPFQVLPDEILAVLLEYLEPHKLLLLGATSKFISPQSKSGSFTWQGTWRSTLLGLSKDRLSQVSCNNVFSDVLYRPFLCTHTSLVPYASNIPQANAIARFENLSAADFSGNWSDKPFILTGPVREWPVYQSWETDSLLEQYGDVKFRAEAVDWTLDTYIKYMRDNSDESPLYLFDRSFVEKMKLQPGKQQERPSYWIPECFGDDLFAVLGNQRPDDKWLIIGPARSGSTYHKDPNATSAWNAVLRGSKYWIMFPSDSSSPPPPGVYVSEDQSEVTSPLSIAEWLLGFHAEARKTAGCVEGVCGEGEVLHVPSGWWHLVVNLDASIAITQNFVPRSHLAGVLSFLKEKPDQVSGFKKDVRDPYGTFVEGMQSQHPELLKQAFEELRKKAEGKKRKWDEAVGKEDGKKDGGFSFGFGDDSDEEIP
ncbi:F-box protein [Lachnellula suecica]|uniref:F-box protein n=1 Tax=Lachnellula suecica TaxID=602035 RepID=A0A8T9BTV6_9HELO|nr:F-box protein [Lachnellula suecica]